MGRTLDAGGLAVIAGSGMGPLGVRLASRMVEVETVRFDDIDGVGACTVEGHAGEVRLGRVAPAPGRGHRRLALVSGRRHTYEGGSAGMAALMRWLAGRGVRDVVAISAAGSLRDDLFPGELVLAREVVDMQNRHRLQRAFRDRARDAGKGREVVAPDGAAACRGGGRGGVSSGLTGAVDAAARRSGVPLRRGTLVCAAGPAYETPAEVRALQLMGADVATMSSAPETHYAAEWGMKIAIIAAITNRCTGIGLERPDHARVLTAAATMCGGLAAILSQLIER